MNNQPKKANENNRPAMRPMFGRPVQKPKNFKLTIKKIFKYLSPFKLQLVAVTFFAIASTALSIIGPKILGKITTSLYLSATTHQLVDFDYIASIIMILILLYLASALALYFQSYIMFGVSLKVSYILRKDTTKKINSLPLKYFDQKPYGQILSIVTNDIDTIAMSLNQSLTQIISSIATLLGIFIMMLTISWKLSILVFLILPTFMFLLMLLIKKSQKFFISQARELARLNGHIEEAYSGHLIIKAYNKEDDMIKSFNVYNKNLYNTAWKAQFLSGVMMPIIGFIGNICYVGVCIFGGYLIIRGEIIIGDFQAFLQYVRSFFNPLTQTASASNVIQAMAASAERVFEFLEQSDDVGDIDNPIVLDNVKGDVEFKNIKFGYSSEKTIINDFSTSIKKGQKVAIVGPTGAGKTTIVKLLMRFYELNSGQIEIDGVNIDTITKYDLRKSFGMVLQDTWLFNGTIMENIRFGNSNASDQEVIQACTLANCDDFIRSLPEGYNFIINEDATNISQGQKQLLTIARALLANPKVLILDEATSNVDTRTEIIIQEAMEVLMRGKTTFIIAHRLSTVRNCDIILVMNQGDIVETGDHQTLLDKKGVYFTLYNSQFDQN